MQSPEEFLGIFLRTVSQEHRMTQTVHTYVELLLQHHMHERTVEETVRERPHTWSEPHGIFWSCQQIKVHGDCPACPKLPRLSQQIRHELIFPRVPAGATLFMQNNIGHTPKESLYFYKPNLKLCIFPHRQQDIMDRMESTYNIAEALRRAGGHPNIMPYQGCVSACQYTPYQHIVALAFAMPFTMAADSDDPSGSEHCRTLSLNQFLAAGHVVSTVSFRQQMQETLSWLHSLNIFVGQLPAQFIRPWFRGSRITWTIMPHEFWQMLPQYPADHSADVQRLQRIEDDINELEFTVAWIEGRNARNVVEIRIKHESRHDMKSFDEKGAKDSVSIRRFNRKAYKARHDKRQAKIRASLVKKPSGPPVVEDVYSSDEEEW